MRRIFVGGWCRSLGFVLGLTLFVAGCGGGGGDTTPPPVSLSSVSAFYPSNGANWNDYVQGETLGTATDTACNASSDTACLHGGEIRVVELPDLTSCSGLSAQDALGIFTWTCDSSTGSARMISTGLADGKHLSDLIDFATQSWRENSVTVYNQGVAWGVTPTRTWWTNPVVVDNDGGSLDSEGTIYLVTNDALVSGYTIDANSVALVGEPGVIINGPGGGSGSIVIEADGWVGYNNFVWIEANVDAAGDDDGVVLSWVSFSRLDNLNVSNADFIGIYLNSSSYNTLSGISASNTASYGLYVSSSWGNRLSDIKTSHNASGIVMDTGTNNTFAGVVSVANGSGLQINSATNNIFAGLDVSNNTSSGVILSSSDRNLFAGLTACNNFTGVLVNSSSNNVFSGVTANNNSGDGIDFSAANQNSLVGIAAFNNETGIALVNASQENTIADSVSYNNRHSGILLESASGNYFTGQLAVGYNAIEDCRVNGGTNPGLDDDADPADAGTDSVHAGLCVQQGASDFGSVVVGTRQAFYVGPVTTDDVVNTSDTSGTASYPTDPGSFDWTHFENEYRAWGGDGADIWFDPAPGPWTSGTGRLWDWSLSLQTPDSEIRNALAVPAGNDYLVHTWLNTTTTTFLRHAIEVQGDGIGNDNILCESGETCLYTPNVGSYQGHGNLINAEGFSDGTLTGIVLKKYENNGR